MISEGRSILHKTLETSCNIIICAHLETYPKILPKLLSTSPIMKSLLYLVTILAALTCANDSAQDQCPPKRNGCLSQNDVNHILNNWPRLFDTEDANWLINNINCTVAEDFVSYNEGTMVFGKSFSASFIHPIRD